MHFQYIKKMNCVNIKFEDIKGVTRSRKSKDINIVVKRTNQDLQIIIQSQKTYDREHENTSKEWVTKYFTANNKFSNNNSNSTYNGTERRCS